MKIIMMRDLKRNTGFYGWNNSTGVIIGVVQIGASAAIPGLSLTLVGTLVGSGTAGIVYSVTTNNDDMSLAEYFKNMLIGGAIGGMTNTLTSGFFKPSKSVSFEPFDATKLNFDYGEMKPRLIPTRMISITFQPIAPILPSMLKNAVLSNELTSVPKLATGYSAAFAGLATYVHGVFSGSKKPHTPELISGTKATPSKIASKN